MKKNINKFYADPILKEINFGGDNSWMLDLINTEEFERLGRIHQLGFSNIIFPSATHTRFSHSLGTYEITRRFIEHLELNKKNKLECKYLLCAALLHDIGHGPFSHTFETYTNTNHEEFTKQLICNKNSNLCRILTENGIDPKKVIEILSKKTIHKWAVSLIDSQIDSDRMDYLNRDSRYTGAAYGQINPTYIIKGSVLINDQICFNKKIISEIENLLIGRFHMYKQVYEHKNTIKYEFLIQAIFKRIKYLFLKKYKFVDKRNLINSFKPIFENKNFTNEQFLELDDSLFSVFIESLKYENDPILKKLLKAHTKPNFITIKQIKTNNKNSINNDFLSGYYTTKNVCIYHTNIDPIYINDNGKPIELSKLSEIIKKLSNVSYKATYVVKIN